MVRTQIQLSEREADAVKLLARERSVSMAVRRTSAEVAGLAPGSVDGRPPEVGRPSEG